MNKWKSRKFWMAVAAFLASIGATIAGLSIESKAVAVAGIVCTMLSSAIYAAAEAYADGNRPAPERELNEEDVRKTIL